MTKVFCISKAAVQLPINLEDAARSEVDFQKDEQVMNCMQIIFDLSFKLTIGRVCFRNKSTCFRPEEFDLILQFQQYRQCRASVSRV